MQNQFQLKFNNGKFRILQMSDLQDTKRTSVDTLRFVESAVKKYKPDLIVLTGDQLDVAGMWKAGDNKKNVERAIRSLFSVLESSGVPYALTFGNHDRETGISNEEQVEIYASLRGCIGFENLNDGRPDAATFNLPIFSSDGKKAALNLYIIDTHSKTKGIGYKGVTDEQLDWSRRVSEKLRKENGGAVPSMIFQHIPVNEMFTLFDEVPRSTAENPAFRDPNGKMYALRRDVLQECTAYGETPSTQLKENRQFSAAKQQGDIFAMYFGHDHYNAFVGKVDGIDLGYCPGTGYNSYGLRKRAMRVFDFDESDVKGYKTYVVDYDDCCDKSEAAPIKNFLSCRTPSNLETAGPFAAKCTVLTLAVIAALVLLYFLVSKIFVKTLLLLSLAAGAIYFIASSAYNAALRRKYINKTEVQS